MKRRTIAALLACTMVIGTLAGCSSEPKNPGDSNEPVTTAAAGTSGESQAGEIASAEESGLKIFHDYMTTDVDTINPHIYTMSVSGDVIARTSLQLYRQYPNAEGTSFEYLPELAEKEPEQTDEEGKVWHIKIRENAKWENGDAIDVDDVIYSFKMCLDPIMVNSRASQLASDYITITKASDYSLQGNAGTVAWEDVGIKKADDYTLELQLDAPVTAEDIKSHFNYVWTCLVHEPTYEACMSEDRSTNTYGSTREKYMSCGAFILDQWIAGSQFDMKKNPDFVLGDKIKLDGYNYKIVGDRNTALELYLNGELDAVSLSPESIEQYIDDPSIKKAPATSIQTLTINHGNTNNNGILGNLNFRKALFYAVDRESIAKMTNGIPANYLVASKCLGLDGKTYRDMEESQALLEPNLGYDPAKAKELLTEAGYPDGFSCQLWVNGDVRTRSAQMVQAQLAEIGITVDISTMEWGAFLDALNAGEHEMFILGWSNSSFDADSSTYQLFHSANHGATGNRAFMTDATVDELITKAAQENDNEKRMEYYKELQIYLHDLSPWCPFYYKNDNVGVRADLQGFKLHKGASHYLGNCHYAK